MLSPVEWQAGYEVGYQLALQRIRPLVGTPYLNRQLLLEAKNLALCSVYGPAPTCPVQVGYAAALSLLHYESSGGYQWLGPPEDLLAAK